MDIRRKESKEYYFPFSELLTGDNFMLHEQHLNGASPVFVKTGSHSYKNVDTEDSHTLNGLEVHRTWVSLAPSCYLF